MGQNRRILSSWRQRKHAKSTQEVKIMAEQFPYQGKVKNQATQEIKGAYVKTDKGKAKIHTGNDLRTKGKG